MGRFSLCFKDADDPRTGNAKRHDFREMVMVALLSSMCGGQTCVDMVDFAANNEAFLRRFMTLARGAPSRDTFSRLFRLLAPEPVAAAMAQLAADWAKALEKNGGRRIAIDGKVLRRSHMCAGETSPLHMAGALLPEAGSRSARMHHERSVEGEHPSFAAIELQAAQLLEQSVRFSSASRTPRARSSAGCLGVGFASAIGPIRVASGSSVQLLALRQTRGSSQFLRCLPECVARILFTSMLHEFPCHAA